MKTVLIAFVVAVVASLGSGPIILPMLRRLKVGQSIREEGPKSHMSKAGTPTMGGIIILIGLVFGIASYFKLDTNMNLMLFSTIGFGLIGFLDDYIKVVLKRNLGLRAYQKIIGQLLVSVVLAYYASRMGTDIYVPIIKKYIDLGFLYIPFMVFVMLAVTNAVNLTDGLDGLAGSITLIVTGFFGYFAYTMGYLSVAVFAAALMGGCIGFLKYNNFPAKVFMGDTGSLALGGAIAAMAILTKSVLLIPVAGGIFVAETLSVIIQVISFKTTGKRVFKMSPLHHHYELSGWKETKVVRVFRIVSVILCIVAYLIV
ncbi:MAG: phospho-N-acetylmuramoyl-pentapeptide-transferase [Firmicutes bacterium]|nr:phospho-N-acetylmuramoyl-pentapeptide-transferase [Bacillota bacterium]